MNKRSEEIVENIFRGIDVDGVEEGININRGDLEEIYQEGFEAGQKAALQWQPIETLDSTQKQVLLFNKDWDVAPYKVGEIYQGKIMVVGGRFYYDYAPVTHWMPIPPAPEVSDD